MPEPGPTPEERLRECYVEDDPPRSNVDPGSSYLSPVKVVEQVRDAEQAAREERDREWREALGLNREVRADEALRQIRKAARRAALEEAAEAYKIERPWKWKYVADWLRARAEEE